MRKETTGGAKKKKKKDLRFTTQSSPDSELQFLQGFQRNRNISQSLYSQKYDMQRLTGVLLFELSFVRFQNRTYLTTLVVKRNRVENGRRNGVSDPRMPNCKLKSGIVRGGCRITKGYSSLWTWPNSANGRGNFGQWPDLPTRRYVFFYTKEETGNPIPSFPLFESTTRRGRWKSVGWKGVGWLIRSVDGTVNCTGLWLLETFRLTANSR